MLLNNQQVTEEIQKEIKTCIETNDSENTAQNLWDSLKAVIGGKFRAINHTLRHKRHQINSLTLNT